MTTVRIQGYSVATTDTTNRYMTIELQRITVVYSNWPHKIILNKGATGLVYDRYENVDPGSYPVWLGITAYAGTWDIRVVITDSNGNKLMDTTVHVPNEYPIHVGDITVGQGPTTTTNHTPGIDPSELVRKMMEKLMPDMMKMMGMMMVMQMMMGMMSSLAGAFAG
jgi:hypothetical protein